MNPQQQQNKPAVNQEKQTFRPEAGKNPQANPAAGKVDEKSSQEPRNKSSAC